jgi:hypothetical protein
MGTDRQAQHDVSHRAFPEGRYVAWERAGSSGRLWGRSRSRFTEVVIYDQDRPGETAMGALVQSFPSLGNFFGALTLHGWTPVHESVDTYHAYAFCCVQAIGATR